jgi:hypothetical protein
LWAIYRSAPWGLTGLPSVFSPPRALPYNSQIDGHPVPPHFGK